MANPSTSATVAQEAAEQRSQKRPDTCAQRQIVEKHAAEHAPYGRAHGCAYGYLYGLSTFFHALVLLSSVSNATALTKASAETPNQPNG